MKNSRIVVVLLLTVLMTVALVNGVGAQDTAFDIELQIVRGQAQIVYNGTTFTTSPVTLTDSNGASLTVTFDNTPSVSFSNSSEDVILTMPSERVFEIDGDDASACGGLNTSISETRLETVVATNAVVNQVELDSSNINIDPTAPCAIATTTTRRTGARTTVSSNSATLTVNTTTNPIDVLSSPPGGIVRLSADSSVLVLTDTNGTIYGGGIRYGTVRCLGYIRRICDTTIGGGGTGGGGTDS